MQPERMTTQTRAGTQIDAGLRSYMLRVYNYMAVGVGLTGVVVMLLANMPGVLATIASTGGYIVLFIAVLAMGWFSPKILSMKNQATAQLYYWAYVALWGAWIAPTVVAHLGVDGGVFDVARAFFITTGMFAGMSILGYTTKKDLKPMGSFLFMAIIGFLLIAIFQGIFFGFSSTFSLIASSVFVLLFAGMTAYETQAIKDMYTHNARMGGEAVSRMAVFGALMIYGNFVVMFIHILNILGIMRD